MRKNIFESVPENNNYGNIFHIRNINKNKKDEQLFY